MSFEPRKEPRLFALVYEVPESFPMGRMSKRAEKHGKAIFKNQHFEVLDREWRDDLKCGVNCWLVWIGNPDLLERKQNTLEKEERDKKPS